MSLTTQSKTGTTMKLSRRSLAGVGRVVAMAGLLALGGCLPATFTRVPGINARVVDTEGRPVPGTLVTVRAAAGRQGDSTVDRLTGDSSGRVHRAEQAVWGLYIVSMDNFGASYEVVADAVEGQSAPRLIRRPWSHVRLLGLGAKEVYELGDLRLNPPSTRP